MAIFLVENERNTVPTEHMETWPRKRGNQDVHTLSVERTYSKRQIKEAVRLLGGTVQRTPEVEAAFRVLHNWRLHHAYPMVRERAKLTKLVKSRDGITAGRLKRTSSIRKKLRGSVTLDEMQDIVGCRAILNSMEDIREVLGRYKSTKEGGTVRRIADYIESPKSSGYRSVHIIVRFSEEGIGKKHLGCNVEIQLRTKLQHAWGTAVEAAGSMRNEDLKAGEGCPQWLRFFRLMSGYIAELEGQPRGDQLQVNHKELRDEAKELARSLNVRENLSAYSELLREADVTGGLMGPRYLLKLNSKTGKVDVTPAWREIFAFDDLDDDSEEYRQSIEVIVDNMAALRQAYPNYFLDTRKFLDILADLESASPPWQKSSIDRLDLSFLRKVTPEPVRKTLDLEHTGNVLWGGKRVGRWGKGFYGEHFFYPGRENYVAFQSRNIWQFKADLEDWLESE
jgi:hypothetical protein